MPELPEVETFVRVLRQKLLGRTITNATLLYPRLLITPNREIGETIGKTFESIDRKGKFIIFRLSLSLVLVAHLRMEGKYFVKPASAPRQKADEAVFELDDGNKLIYNDTRKFGVLGIYDDDTYLLLSPLKDVADSPLEMNGDELFLAISSSQKTIKETLLDQSRVSGLGNIYVDETLFKAKINPRRKASSISQKEAEAILREAKATLEEAIKLGGSTIHSFQSEEGKGGQMQNELLCYGKSPSPCPRCGTPLMRIEIGGRGTTYCPSCQIDPSRPFVLGITGPIHSGKSTAARYFKGKGYEVFDCDKEVETLYADKGFAERFAKEFGAKLSNGVLAKSEVKRILGGKRKEAECFIFAAVCLKAEERIKRTKGKLVIDAPLLYQAKMDSLCDCVLFLDSPAYLRAKRLLDEGEDASYLLKLNSAAHYGTYKRKAPYIIDNDGDEGELIEKLKKLPL
ncbi:MAG: DNA-formamidopyrimidine glycosylase [Firmicutes bacterium]|uniref:Formamidopyrimidine-DNA glycosylase n=1 Tax=Candidatus Alloenteromonas pullistercoris TaxID=2840785 RepID=A0A9D9DIL1_9FIRM|nr:DNA-formamidopyrimidine glycosylase [Candidatus Enteromonas pullistercoris]